MSRSVEEKETGWTKRYVLVLGSQQGVYDILTCMHLFQVSLDLDLDSPSPAVAVKGEFSMQLDNGRHLTFCTHLPLLTMLCDYYPSILYKIASL